LAGRLVPTGQVNWAVVDAAILAVEPITASATTDALGATVTLTEPTGEPSGEPAATTAVQLLVDSDHNAVVAERALLAAGTRVFRDTNYNPYQQGSRGFQLIVQPAADSQGVWERDL
jgi:hypothetical protein